MPARVALSPSVLFVAGFPPMPEHIFTRRAVGGCGGASSPPLINTHILDGRAYLLAHRGIIGRDGWASFGRSVKRARAPLDLIGFKDARTAFLVGLRAVVWRGWKLLEFGV